MRSTSHCSGFSLLELLIAVTIIALLCTALLPTLAMVRESTRSVACINNLRQIGLGSMAYATDHRGMAVPSKIEWEAYSASATPTWAGSWNVDWMHQLWEYLPKNGTKATSREIYACPQAKLERVATQWPSAYGANVSVHPINSDYVGDKPGRPDRSLWAYTRLAQIPRPTEVISFMDASVNSVGTSTETLLYSDTAHQLRASEQWRADCQADGIYGIGVWASNNNSDKNAYLPRWRHQRNTTGGVVFVDGHAGLLSRKETLIKNFSTAY